MTSWIKTGDAPIWLNLKIDVSSLQVFKGFCEVRFYTDNNVILSSSRMDVEVLPPKVVGVAEPFMKERNNAKL